MYVCVCASACLSVWLSLCHYVRIYIYLSVCTCMCLYVFVCMFACMCVCVCGGLVVVLLFVSSLVGWLLGLICWRLWVHRNDCVVVHSCMACKHTYTQNQTQTSSCFCMNVSTDTSDAFQVKHSASHPVHKLCWRGCIMHSQCAVLLKSFVS